MSQRRVAGGLVVAIAAGVVGQLCTVAVMLAIAAAIDRVFVGGQALGDIAALLLVAAGAVAVRAASVVVAEIGADATSGRIRAELRGRLVGELFRIGPAGMLRQRDGDVAATVGAGVESLHELATRFAPAAALAVTGPLIVFAAVAVLDPWTTLILLFTGPMLVLLLAVIGGRTRALTARRFDELGWLSAFYLDMVRGLPTLKAFGRSREGAETIETVSRRLGDTTMDVLRTAFQTSLVMEWAATAATALVAVQVSFRMIEAGMGFGTALAVLVLVPEFFLPFRRLALEYHTGQAGRAALERIARLTDGAQPEPSPLEPAPWSAVSAGRGSTAPSIEFRDVSFTYPGSDRPALHRLDLRLDPGRSVALVGPSGTGKTTAARLLMRFIEPSEGALVVDGRAMASIDPAAWRRHVAWVPQDPSLFAGTIAQNIALGEPDAARSRVRAAAEAAGAAAFIDDLADGYDTELGEQGLRLSGGQRQRLAIARAILRDAPVVVLDEFTAHLDDDTEADVLAAVRRLLVGRTALLIAHRSQTIAAADTVVELREAHR